MESTEGMKLWLSRHAREQIITKFGDAGLERAEETFSNPDKIYPNKSYEGQFRVVGEGLCLIGKPTDDGKYFRVFTAYEDGVLTPPREDQLETEAGQRYAELYEAALKKGRVERTNEYYPRVKERKRGSDIPHAYIR